MESNREKLGAIAGGDVLPYLSDGDPKIRRLAVSAAAALEGEDVTTAIVDRLTDTEPTVRAEAVEVLGARGADIDTVEALLTDSSSRVVEAAVTALGELADPRPVPWLLAAAAQHEEQAVREAAIAALGAIGDDAAVPVLIEIAAIGKPQLRRRAVVALTAFDGPEVEAALATARLDRNPMVREVAEMVLGRDAPGS